MVVYPVNRPTDRPIPLCTGDRSCTESRSSHCCCCKLQLTSWRIFRLRTSSFVPCFNRNQEMRVWASAAASAIEWPLLFENFIPFDCHANRFSTIYRDFLQVQTKALGWHNPSHFPFISFEDGCHYYFIIIIFKNEKSEKRRIKSVLITSPFHYMCKREGEGRPRLERRALIKTLQTDIESSAKKGVIAFVASCAVALYLPVQPPYSKVSREYLYFLRSSFPSTAWCRISFFLSRPRNYITTVPTEWC